MIDIESYSRITSSIYDSALNADRWSIALRDLASLFEGGKAQMSYYQMDDAQPYLRYWGFEQDLVDRVMPEYLGMARADPRMPPRLFKAYHCRQILCDDDLRSTEMYRRVLAPAGIEYSMYFGLDLDGYGQCALAVMRGPEQAPFTEADCEDFGRFIPHVSRAVMLYGALRRAQGDAATTLALIDRVPTGIMVVRDDELMLANAAARSLLDRGDCLRLAAGRLQAASAQGRTMLERALHDARGVADRPIGVTLPAGESAQVRVVVRGLDLDSAHRLGAGGGGLALYLSDSRQSIEAPEEVLRRMFGLTEREATVLCALAQGEDTRGVARRLQIGVETAKTHIRHIMQAVGVRRQIDLIRLVLSSPAWTSEPAGARSPTDS